MSTSLLTQNLGKRFRYGQMDRLLYLTDGLHQPKMYDGSNLVNWGIKAPTTAPTVSASSTGANVLDLCEVAWTPASTVLADGESSWSLYATSIRGLVGTSADCKVGSKSALLLIGTTAEPISANTYTLLHLDTDFTDSSAAALTWAKINAGSGDTVIDTTIKKFGAGSLKVDGAVSADQGIQTDAVTPFNIGTGDFTLEFNMYVPATAAGSIHCFSCSYEYSGATGFHLEYVPASGLWISYWASFNMGSISSAISFGAWHTIGYQRKSGVINLYVDGINKGQFSSPGHQADSIVPYTGSKFRIGRNYVGAGAASWNHPHYFDEFRYDKGTARLPLAGYVPATEQYGTFSTTTSDPTGITGLAAYYNNTIADLSTYYGLKFWIKSAKTTVVNDLALVICDNTGGTAELERIPIPSLAADSWTEVTYQFANAALLTSVASLAISINRDLGANAVYLDDIRGIRCKISLDSNSPQEGAASVKIEIPGNVPDDTLVAYRDLPVTHNMSGDTVVLMGVKTNKATGFQQLQYLLDDTVACASPIESIYLTENLAADTWTNLTLPIANPAACTAIASHGLKVKSRTIAPITVWLDNIKRATTAAGNLTGRYFVWVSFYNSKYDKESDLSPISSVIDCAAQAINVASIPLSTDTQCDMRRIYRSAAGGAVPYLDTTIADNTSTTIVLNQSDAALSARRKHPSGASGSGKYAPPPACPYLVQYKNRFITAGSVTYSRGTVDVVNGSATFTYNLAQLDDSFVGRTLRVVGDDLDYTIESVNAGAKTCVARPIDDPVSGTYRGTTATKKPFTITGLDNSFATSFVDDSAIARPHGFPIDYYQDVLEGRANDRITGLGLIGDAILVTKAYSAHIAEGTFPPFTTTRISEVIGCVSHDTIVQDERSYGLWLAGEQGMAYSEGFNVQIISTPIAEIFDGTDDLGLNTSLYQYAHAVYDIKMKLYYLFVASKDSSRNNVCIVLDKSANDPTTWVWYYYHGIEAACSTIMYDENGVGTIYIGDYDGFMYQLNIGYYDGVALGTLRGTPTSATGNTLTDTGASLYTNGSGLKGIPLLIVNTLTGTVYTHKIKSNTSTVITIEDAFSETLSAVHRYYIGGYAIEWYSKVQEMARVTDKKLLIDGVVNNYELDATQITKISVLKDLKGSVLASQLFDFSTGEEQVMLIRERVSQAQWKVEGFVHGQPIQINSFGLRFRPRGIR